MAGLKCNMCGGALPFTKGGSLVTCEYCGAQQILPRSLDDKLVKRFDLANDYRAHCEFDKAAILYDQILLDAPDDPEAYWGRVLCRYGIEYVTAKDGKRTATCHRTQFKSILKDPDYLSAMRYADSDGKRFYGEQAAYIDTIRKGILSVSSKEAPFDIFICYKEKDETGARTVDSVIGQNLYNLLTAHGYRVFFSRITLEDKLGTAYEPYIFSALNSARVMLVLGTKPEYFTAVWVKNEWSRYLSMMQEGKYLIPCYRDMSPYDMPEEFHALQAQNLSAIGFEQDLLHGIAKLIGTKQPEPAHTEAEDDDACAADHDEAEQAASRRRKKLTVTLIAAAVVALALSTLLLVFAFKRPSGTTDGMETTVGSRATVPVDDFIGLYLTQIDPKDYPDLKVNVTDYDEEFSDSFKAGAIIDQTPKAGDLVRFGREVRFVVSKGPIKMPDFTNQRGDTALSELEALAPELKMQTAEEASETVAKGCVVRTEPVAGAVLKKNQTVMLYISLGSNKMLDLTNDTESDAREKMESLSENLNLRFRLQSEASDSVPSGSVIRTEPAAGTALEQGQQVTIYISLGSNKMPELANLTPEAAEQRLNDMNMDLKITFLYEESSSVPSGSVIRTEPAAGTALEQGQRVTIYVSLGQIPVLANLTPKAAKLGQMSSRAGGAKGNK